MRLTLLLLTIGAIWAQQGSNLAGIWKLDLTRSKLADGKPLTLYRDFRLTIAKDGDKLIWTERLTYPEGALNESTNAFATDYRVHKFARTSDGKPGENLQMRARWLGAELFWMVWNSSASAQRRIRLSADGQTMTTDFELIDGNRHINAREIWLRQ